MLYLVSGDKSDKVTSIMLFGYTDNTEMPSVLIIEIDVAENFSVSVKALQYIVPATDTLKLNETEVRSAKKSLYLICGYNISGASWKDEIK